MFWKQKRNIKLVILDVAPFTFLANTLEVQMGQAIEQVMHIFQFKAYFNKEKKCFVGFAYLPVLFWFDFFLGTAIPGNVLKCLSSA